MDNHATGQAVLLNYMVYSGNYIFKNDKDKESKRESKKREKITKSISQSLL